MNGHLETDEIYLVAGKSPRNIQHIVIYQNGKMIHDPYPDGGGLLSDSESNYYSLRQFKIIDSLENITTYLRKQYAKSIGLTDTNAYKHIGIAGINDIKIKRKSNNLTYSFWAGISGCNWNLVDSTGGNHMCENIKNEIFELELNP